MNRFQTMQGLLHSVAVYVPSTLDVNKETDNARQVNSTLASLSTLFGGCTGYDVHGAWMSNANGLVVESVTVCKSYADVLTDEALESVYAIANQIKADMGQEAVSVEIDNALYFV
jgi:hypothetical protein